MSISEKDIVKLFNDLHDNNNMERIESIFQDITCLHEIDIVFSMINNKTLKKEIRLFLLYSIYDLSIDFSQYKIDSDILILFFSIFMESKLNKGKGLFLSEVFASKINDFFYNRNTTINIDINKPLINQIEIPIYINDLLIDKITFLISLKKNIPNEVLKHFFSNIYFNVNNPISTMDLESFMFMKSWFNDDYKIVFWKDLFKRNISFVDNVFINNKLIEYVYNNKKIDFFNIIMDEESLDFILNNIIEKEKDSFLQRNVSFIIRDEILFNNKKEHIKTKKTILNSLILNLNCIDIQNFVFENEILSFELMYDILNCFQFVDKREKPFFYSCYFYAYSNHNEHKNKKIELKLSEKNLFNVFIGIDEIIEFENIEDKRTFVKNKIFYYEHFFNEIKETTVRKFIYSLIHKSDLFYARITLNKNPDVLFNFIYDNYWSLIDKDTFKISDKGWKTLKLKFNK